MGDFLIDRCYDDINKIIFMILLEAREYHLQAAIIASIVIGLFITIIGIILTPKKQKVEIIEEITDQATTE